MQTNNKKLTLKKYSMKNRPHEQKIVLYKVESNTEKCLRCVKSLMYYNDLKKK